MAVIGLDVGTTSAKAVAYSSAGAVLSTGRVATPWGSTPHGVEMDADALFDAARTALLQAADAAGEPIRGIGITSMAESGILLDARGRSVAPVIAWHDARDGVEVQELADQIGAEEFAERTGKPLRGQWSLTKHRWLRRHHAPARAASQRFNVAEWIVRQLGGEEVTELSLACRTGWFDVSTSQWWADGLAFSDVDADLMPPLVEAGVSVGQISAGPLAGAALTLAGHDHQAAALGAGAHRDGVEFDSCGTAEALVRILAAAPTADQLRALAAHGITTDVSIQAGRWSLLGGTEGGLAMQRTLGVLGVGAAQLAVLDDEALAATGARVQISGLGTAALTIGAITDGATRGDVWRAAVQAAADDAARLHSAMNDIVGPAGEVVAAGGWTNSAMFMQAKRATLGAVRRSDVTEAGTRGAALLAARVVGELGPNDDLGNAR